jgi:hypothetical protein
MRISNKPRCIRTETVFGLCQRCGQAIDGEAHLAETLEPGVPWLFCSACCSDCAPALSRVELVAC